MSKYQSEKTDSLLNDTLIAEINNDVVENGSESLAMGRSKKKPTTVATASLEVF